MNKTIRFAALFAAMLVALLPFAATAQETVWDGRVTSDPEEGSYESIEKGFTLSFLQVKKLTVVDASAVNLVRITGVQQVETVGIKVSTNLIRKNALIVRPVDGADEIALPKGEYQLIVGAGAVDLDGLPNPELIFSYEVTASAEPEEPDPATDEIYTLTPPPGEVESLDGWEIAIAGQWWLNSRNAKFTLTCSDPSVEIPALLSYSNGTNFIVYFEDEAEVTAPGTYTFTIPDNKFGVGETLLPGQSFEYVIPAGGARFPAYVMEPAAGSYETLTDGFSMRFDSEDEVVVDRSLVSLTGPGDVAYALFIEAGRMASLTVIPVDGNDDPLPLTEPGRYTLTFQPGALTVGEASNRSTIAFIYDLSGIPQPIEWTVAVDPQDGTSAKSFRDFRLKFVGATTARVSDTVSGSGFPSFVNKVTGKSVGGIGHSSDNEYNAASPARAASRADEPDFDSLEGRLVSINLVKEVTEGGEYVLRIPREFLIIDGRTMPEDLTFNYTIEKEAAAFPFTVGVRANDVPGGTRLNLADNRIYVTFEGEGLASVSHNEFAWGKENPHFTNADGKYCPPIQTSHYEGNTFVLTHAWPFDEGGRYVLVVPDGFFTLTHESGATATNDAFSVALTVGAEGDLENAPKTVIFEENFDGDYTRTFPYMYDADHLEPNKAIASLFYSNAAGGYMPWWVVKDSDASSDRFMASHSYYDQPGTSNDWLISVPVAIPTAGFTLTFGAQSVPVRSSSKLSDLAVYVTESMLDPQGDIPDEETALFEEVPYGRDPNNCEGDWTRYSLPLDAYAGKTVYINFVNQNYDNDILCIDNVRIERTDIAAFAMDPLDRYVAADPLPVKASLTAAATLTNWNISLYVGNSLARHWDGARMEAGETLDFEAEVTLERGVETEIRFEFTCFEQGWPQEASASVTRMMFTPVHRVFLEETTSLHCGNCPAANFVVENILDDEDLGDRFVPVSVHIMNLGFDPMAVAEYYGKLPDASQAPMLYVDRNVTPDGITVAYDVAQYDPTDERSFAYRIARRIAEPTTVALDVEGTWVVEGSDTIAIDCRAKVVPALDLAGKDLRVAFILTENNVGLDYNEYWLQENYMSGLAYDHRVAGWADLPKTVFNARYHDVARAISAFNGHENSLPADLQANREYIFTHRLAIPQTHRMNGNQLIADHIQRQFCQLIAVVLDAETGLAVNAAKHPMSDVANCRYTAADLARDLGAVEAVEADAADLPAEYFDLYGRRVDASRALAPGLYIRRQGTSARPVLVR